MAAKPDAGAPVNRSEMKLHAALLTQMCLDSVNDMARGVGGDSFRDDALFQRYFRDLNVVARPAFLDLETAGESYAKLLQLGRGSCRERVCPAVWISGVDG